MGVKATVDFGPEGRTYTLKLVVDMADPAESYGAICQAGELAQELLAQAKNHFGQALQQRAKLQAAQAKAQSHRADILCRAYAGE